MLLRKWQIVNRKTGVSPIIYNHLSPKQESGQLIRKHADFPQLGKSARIQSSLSSP